MDEIKILEGKKVVCAKHDKENDAVSLVFDDGSMLTATARAGGAGADWVTWTDVTLKTPLKSITLINK